MPEQRTTLARYENIITPIFRPCCESCNNAVWSVSVRQKLKTELLRIEKLDVITPVGEPTPLVSQRLITLKKTGAMRVFIDPRELNKALLHEHYILPILNEALHEIRQSRVFSLADLSSGYWHVGMDNSPAY